MAFDLGTIRLQLQAMPDAVVDAAGARRPQQALESMSDDVPAYKQLAPARSRLVAWLSNRSAPWPATPGNCV